MRFRVYAMIAIYKFSEQNSTLCLCCCLCNGFGHRWRRNGDRVIR